MRRAWLRCCPRDHAGLPHPRARLGSLRDIGGRQRHEIREWGANTKLDRAGACSGRHLPDHAPPGPQKLVDNVIRQDRVRRWRDAQHWRRSVRPRQPRLPMPNLNRRTVLAAAAGSLAAHALPAFAASPYAFKHGAFEVTVVSDGHLVLPTSFLAPGAPPAELQAILNAAGQTGDQYQSPTNITLVRSERDLILIDMGSGDRFMPSAGKLWDNLKAAGIDKAKITKVVFTHGHPDHL